MTRVMLAHRLKLEDLNEWDAVNQHAGCLIGLGRPWEIKIADKQMELDGNIHHWGFAPDPTSYFFLIRKMKQKESRKS